MKKILVMLSVLLVAATATAQLKPRPDAFPPEEEPLGSKVLNMATSVEQMASWNRYPTYSVYLSMMQGWATAYPNLCRLDTIGTSINGRLILSLEITAHPTNPTLPEFFYSSTIHGDEITGYVMMLRLIDTLLHGYGSNPQYTSLINRTRICINPLANPDGTYYGGDNTVQNSRRYNANNVDLNRNYPNPFSSAKETLQQENAAMISYFDRHNFRLSANLHGGAEVMNYPWDTYTSAQLPHPMSAWWVDVCRRFVDTSRTYNSNHFNDTYSCGYTAGGDWYVITGGRQDYFNYYYNCLELTMEISTTKKLSSTQLPTYWNFLQHSLVNYIEEIHTLFPHNTIEDATITYGDILYWAGSGDNSAIVAINWADSALAWGIRFAQDSITARQALDTIATHDWRFSFDSSAIDILYADSTDTLHITPGYQWQCLLNGHTANGMSTRLGYGDLIKWGDLSAAVLADSIWNDDSLCWNYTYVWTDSIYPVSALDSTIPSDPPTPPDPPVNITTVDASSLVVYPNPATDRITINCNDGTSEIYDITGHLLLRKQLSNSDNTIDLSGHAKGIYILRCGGATIKVVKQ